MTWGSRARPCPASPADATIPEPVQNPGPAGEADFLSIYERAW